MPTNDDTGGEVIDWLLEIQLFALSSVDWQYDADGCPFSRLTGRSNVRPSRTSSASKLSTCGTAFTFSA